MAFWNKLFHYHQPVKAAPEMASQAVVGILATHRLLGEILLQLSRQFDDHQPGVVGLRWVGDRLALVINPTTFTQLRMDDARLLLAHEALHVLWQHPRRYADHPHPRLVKVATDMAVNQYLPAAPRARPPWRRSSACSGRRSRPTWIPRTTSTCWQRPAWRSGNA